MTRVRPAAPTVAFIDPYGAHYRSLFHNVRQFEQFTALPLGLLAETRRKSLPRQDTTVHTDPQALHHFWPRPSGRRPSGRRPSGRWRRCAPNGSPCRAKHWARRRSSACLDETGVRKRGHTTDYVASQYIGTLHGLAHGIVSVKADGVLGITTFPLLCRSFKPDLRPKPGAVATSKPQLAVEIIEELLAVGLRCRGVWADSRYGESGPFIAALHRLHLQYVVALRANHGAWMLPGQRIRQTRWRPFARGFTDGSTEQRFLRKTVYGTRRSVRYYQITTDPGYLHVTAQRTFLNPVSSAAQVPHLDKTNV